MPNYITLKETEDGFVRFVFIPMDGNEVELAALTKDVNMAREKGNLRFSVDLKPVDEMEVNEILNEPDSGWGEHIHEKIKGLLKWTSGFSDYLIDEAKRDTVRAMMGSSDAWAKIFTPCMDVAPSYYAKLFFENDDVLFVQINGNETELMDFRNDCKRYGQLVEFYMDLFRRFSYTPYNARSYSGRMEYSKFVDESTRRNRHKYIDRALVNGGIHRFVHRDCCHTGSCAATVVR